MQPGHRQGNRQRSPQNLYAPVEYEPRPANWLDAPRPPKDDLEDDQTIVDEAESGTGSVAWLTGIDGVWILEEWVQTTG